MVTPQAGPKRGGVGRRSTSFADSPFAEPSSQDDARTVRVDPCVISSRGQCPFPYCSPIRFNTA